ncbi:MAG: hypothetical protein A2992_01505 [Elusimicrobia bacterium RIFCSPLOWO2_01_FULL_59_12]|nr:MAG: hypothetical protein A2992_01505 [Elusimicrobia bacterium RIFCSPLOWO2_01_FULL_59_12]
MKNYSLWVFCACAIGPASVWGLDPGGAQSFAVYSGRNGQLSHYVPSGYMGDISSLSMSGAYIPTHDGNGTPLKVQYRPAGPKGWAGVYWQHPANNWGDRPGRTGYDLRGARRLLFWARGEKGGEKIHEVRLGGIVGRFPDSASVAKGPINLTKDWRRYEIELGDKDLRHIIGGFGFSLVKRDNVGEVIFYLDDIGYEFPQTAALPKAESAPAEPAGAGSKALAPPAVVPKDLQIKTEDAGLRVSFSSQFLFATGKTVLQPGSSGVLDQVINILKAYPKNDVLVEGHTDSAGSAEYNLALSRLRAEHVRDYLVRQGGFPLERFRVVGYGQTQPIADNATRGGRAQNRRVEVIILKTAEKL